MFMPRAYRLRCVIDTRYAAAMPRRDAATDAAYAIRVFYRFICAPRYDASDIYFAADACRIFYAAFFLPLRGRYAICLMS